MSNAGVVARKHWITTTGLPQPDNHRRNVRIECVRKVDQRCSEDPDQYKFLSDRSRTKRVSAYPIGRSREVIELLKITFVKGTNARYKFIPFPDCVKARACQQVESSTNSR